MLLLTENFEDNLNRCVKLFRETGGVYRRKTTGQLLNRTAAVSAVRDVQLLKLQEK
jgi:hypothetical protein